MSQRLRPSVPRSGGLRHRAAVPLPIALSWDTMRRCVPPRLNDAALFWDATGCEYAACTESVSKMGAVLCRVRGVTIP